ncbi:hypothetical protein B0J17DRAFT_723295 [Rhizoctonia solani]|nr:hypothetical protein B0J17DRAFT_723295 [Rhizoctonia solani]
MSNSAILLKEKKVLVIGGSSGIGHSIAAAVLANGASVVITLSSQERVEVVVQGAAFDIQDPDALKNFLSREAPFDHLPIIAGKLELTNFPNEDVDEMAKAMYQ